MPGYQPQNWCCVCGKATLKTQHVSCDEETCRNLCHNSCLGDTPVFKCSYTEQLRLQANIPDPVIYISEETDTPPTPLPDDSGESQWEGLERGELVSLVEKLTEEASQQNCVIKSLQDDRDLIIQHRDVFAAALRVADRLIASKQRQTQVATRSQAVSAHAESIDEHWEVVCQDSERWRTWWSSDKPQQIRYAAVFSTSTFPSPARETTTAPPTSTASTATQSDCDTSPASTVTPSATQSDCSVLTTTSTATQSSRDSSSINTANGVDRGASVRPRTSPQTTSGDWRKKKSKREVQQDARKVSSEGLRTHQATKQTQKRAKAKVCEYCSRKGHTSATCHARTDDLRQERLLQRLLTVERHTATPFPPAAPQPAHHLTSFQSLPQPRPLLPQPGIWNQSQGRQWTTPLHQYQQSAADPNHHLGLAGLAHYHPSPWYSQLAPAAN